MTLHGKVDIPKEANVRRQNDLDKDRSSLRDSFESRLTPLSVPGTPSFFLPSFFS